ncbi:MAG: hydrogenase formation protein HypD, partial [Desulfovibrionaceae bacterium]
MCRGLLEKIEVLASEEYRFMEVCGTHTVAIFQSGLRSLLPETIVHLSGPGCPVCVTHESEVNAFIDLAAKDGVILATFGDLMRVPGHGG